MLGNKRDSDEIIIDQFANKIVELGVQTPAVFFLELHKPVCTLAHTGTLLLEPIATPFFGTERINKLKTLLSDRKNIDKLIDLIEMKTNSPVHSGEKVKRNEVSHFSEE